MVATQQKRQAVIVALGLFGFGIYVLAKAPIINKNAYIWLNKYGLWAIAGIFIFGLSETFVMSVFFKKVKHTIFGQNYTKFYSPLWLIIGIMTLILELNK